jgi:hypothetical protein
VFSNDISFFDFVSQSETLQKLFSLLKFIKNQQHNLKMSFQNPGAICNPQANPKSKNQNEKRKKLVLPPEQCVILMKEVHAYTSRNHVNEGSVLYILAFQVV